MSTELSLTEDQLKGMIASTAKDVVGPAITEALKPLTAPQGDFIKQVAAAAAAAKDADEAKNGFDDRTLGKYPIGRKARALAMAALENKSSDPDAAIHAIKSAPGWKPSVAEPTIKWLQHVKATLLSGVANAAGDMVMPESDPEWIALLRNNAVVRGFSRVIPMPRGATWRRKQVTAGTASYQGETDKIALSNLTVGRAQLSYKKLTAATVVGNDLIRFSAGEADRIVQEDLLAVAALREDRAFLVGNPPTDAGSPQGIRYQTKLANIYASAGTSLANFQADLTKAIRLVQAANVPATPANSAFIMSPSTYWTILALTTTTGDWVFRAELASQRLFGFPVKLTTQLETSNSFIGANSGLIIFVCGDYLEVHDSMQRTVNVYVGGAYYDGSAVQSGISNDETVITVIGEHDFFQVYPEAASVITGYAT